MIPKDVRETLGPRNDMETVKIREEVGRGTRGGPYVYVVEGNELVHISEYATGRLPGKYDEVIYDIPKNKLAGKILYCFDFSRSGGAFLIKCRIENFEDGYSKSYEYLELLSERISELHGLKFRVKDPVLKSLLTQFEQLFAPILQDIKKYEDAQNFKISFMGHQSRLEDVFKSPDLYYFTFMCLPKDRSRINSIKVTRRWLYQIWVFKLLCEALKVSKFKAHEYEGKPYWWIEQGSDFSTCVAETPLGEVTFWLEFQPHKGAHMTGMFAERHIPIRPDIVVVKGYFERTEGFIDSKKLIDLMIECKEDPFDKWRNEVNSQILPYQEIFKPKNFIIASLEPVPEDTKRCLENQGIKTIGNLKPNSKSIETLYNTIKEEFGL